MMMGMSTGAARPTPAAPPLPTEPTLWANTPVTVSESDVSGLTVALRPGARISGRIEFIGTKDKPAADQISQISLSILPIAGPTVTQLTGAAKRIEADGRFNTVGYPPGRYNVNALIPPTPAASGLAGWTFRNATIGGRDVSNEGLDVTGNDVTDLIVTFTDTTTELMGHVNDPRNQADKTALVVVFPADTDSWKRGVASTRRLRSVRTSAKGSYAIAGLPPGAYFVAALPDDATTTEWQDPKTLEAIVAVATRVTLGDGEKKSQDLTTQSVR
jgi:hypothetical protein